jgi:hypothetical protein
MSALGSVAVVRNQFSPMSALERIAVIQLGCSCPFFAAKQAQTEETDGDAALGMPS